MMHRLATNYAKNYCNRTPIVKVIVENVVTCFFGDTVYIKQLFHKSSFKHCVSNPWPVCCCLYILYIIVISVIQYTRKH